MITTGSTRAPRLLVIAACLGLVVATAACSEDGADQASGSPVSPAASVACPEPQTKTTPGAPRTVVSGGQPRTYNVWLPQGYTGEAPVPLVLDFHGAFGEAVTHAQGSPISLQAPQRGYLLVAPQAVQGDATAVGWKVPGSGTTPDDVQYVVDLLADLETNYCIDPSRRYATGFSSGAAFTSYLGCRLDVWAAIAPLGGINLTQPCSDRPPVPTITFHGTEDTYVPYDSDLPATVPDPNQFYLGDVGTVVEQYGLRNRCTSPAADTVVADGVTRRAYVDCAADLELYTVAGAGHTYPGGPALPPETAAELGGQSQAINSGTVVLDFFDSHVRAAPPVLTPAAWAPTALPVPFSSIVPAAP